jgi:leucine dehydrogenase
VILRPGHVENRAALFEAFGRCIEQLDGRYITATDSGTSVADMDCIAQLLHGQLHLAMIDVAHQQFRAGGVQLFSQGVTDIAQPLNRHAQAFEVVAAKARHGGGADAGEHAHCRMGRRIACGSGAGDVAGLLGAHPIANDALLSTPCDILAPCGLGAVLNRQSVGQLRCAAVAGSASAQLTNLQVADQLEGRGILYAPDYVINSGGLIYVALKHSGAELPTITAHLSNIGTRLTEIFAHAQAEKRSPARVADELAERLLYR